MIAEYLPQILQAAPVILALIIIEGLLSVDNMLAIAALASRLPEGQKKTALRLGLAGAYVFRGVALLFAGFIMEHEWVKFLGAFYLIHLMAEHFSDLAAEGDEDAETKAHTPRTFWGTVIAIQLMDLSLSVDNVITAVAMSPKLWVVCLGVFLGLLTLWLFATVSLKLVEKFPILEHTAFLLIGYVGGLLLVEMTAEFYFDIHLHIASWQKFIGIAVIMLLSVWYDRNKTFSRNCAPFFKLAMGPVKLYAKVAGTLIAIMLWPFKRIGAFFQKPLASEAE